MQLHVRVASIPEGKDPCDYCLSAGADALKQLIADEMELCNLVIEEAEDPADCLLDDICGPSDYFIPEFEM